MAAPPEKSRRRAQLPLPLTFDLRVVCGVDEAGRGPLAGPVTAAAVVLDPRRPIDGLRDSKQLTPSRRAELAVLIRERAIAYCVASACVSEIDTINILQASLLAMKRAVSGLAVKPTLARVDGNQPPKLRCMVQTIVNGDALDPAISAASILAKTVRDAMMVELHLSHPMYRFDEHKGYATPDHVRLLLQHGPCEHHRRSFAPVREALSSNPSASVMAAAALMAHWDA